MCHFHPILLISFQDELSIQHSHHLSYSGKDHTGHHRNIKLAENRGQLPKTHQHHCILLKTPQLLISVAKRPIAILYTQARDYVMTCCAKIAQQISYEPEIKELMEKEWVAATSSVKLMQPLIIQEIYPQGEANYDNIFPKQAIY